MQKNNISAQQLHLLSINFQSESLEQYAICCAICPNGFDHLLSEAFSHPIFSCIDSFKKATLVLRHLESHLLLSAGIATLSQTPFTVKDEIFFDQKTEPQAQSFWMCINLAGKIGPRKLKTLELSVDEWLKILKINECSIVLPKARAIPKQDLPDLLPLRTGWRFEAFQRLSCHSGACTVSIKTK